MKIFLTLSALLPMIGCTSLKPYKEVASAIPSERLIEVEGQRVYVEQHGQGTPLVMLHGFAASAYSFREIIPELARHHRVVTIDLNGFGWTERPGGADAYTPGGQLRVIEKVLDKLGIGEFSLLGQSWGATLSMIYAAEHPGRVRRLVLVSPVAEFEKPPWYLRNVVGRWVAYKMVRGLLSRPKSFEKVLGNAFHQKEKATPEVSEAYRERLLVEGLPAAFRGFAQGMREGGGMELDLENILAKTLVIAGRHDAIVSLQKCERVVSRIPNARLEVMEKSGHSAPEEEPEAISSAVVNFLRDE